MAQQPSSFPPVPLPLRGSPARTWSGINTSTGRSRRVASGSVRPCRRSRAAFRVRTFGRLQLMFATAYDRHLAASSSRFSPRRPRIGKISNVFRAMYTPILTLGQKNCPSLVGTRTAGPTHSRHSLAMRNGFQIIAQNGGGAVSLQTSGFERVFFQYFIRPSCAASAGKSGSLTIPAISEMSEVRKSPITGQRS